ncbi:MAG: hypothetical protein VKL39_22980 [Leptolyngbyaceae bacterium]|nr:hypothetical protein [Leptolyngbyaceae bacterium]
MKPTFSSSESWQQASILMQPVFIRLIDNIRKQLDETGWKGAYRDVQRWPDGTPPETQYRFQKLQEEISHASPEDVPELQQALEALPQPIPGYELLLQDGDRHITVDLWEVCYTICFLNYEAMQQTPGTPAIVDSGLLDESGQVDWNQLNDKTRQIVSDIFAKLPQSDQPLTDSLVDESLADESNE